MSDTEYFQEEAEYLRRRSWDFIDKLEKLESELNSTTEAEQREQLQTRIHNTRHLLDDYLVEYEALCKEAGLTPESFTPNAPSRDIVAKFSRKAEKTREDLLRGEKIDLPSFFLVPSRNPKFTGRQEEVQEFIQRVLEGGGVRDLWRERHGRHWQERNCQGSVSFISPNLATRAAIA